MTYPNGRVLTYNYNTGLDNNISRLSSISDSTGTLVSYSYLGLSTVVIESYPQPGVELTYVKLSGESNGDAGDQYTGLDRFGRVVDQRWIVISTGAATDRFQYGYDQDSNVLYRNNLVNTSFGELYHANGSSNGYDNLNRLTNFARGVLSASGSTLDTISSPSTTESWSLDALGNWSSVTLNGTAQNRTANQQNEITSISGLTTPGYDLNGNTTTDQAGNTFVYDAWNRLIAEKSGSSTLVSFSYDALGREIISNVTGVGYAVTLYYNTSWQVVEEDLPSGSMAQQYVWNPLGVDSMVERDAAYIRQYVQTDANGNVTSVLDTSGNVQERYIYDPYGAVTVLTPTWTTRSGSLYGWVYLFQSGRYDATSTLYGFRNRYLSPTLGRWVQNDPLGFGGGSDNFYSFVGANPVTNSDPSGLDSSQEGGGAASATDGSNAAYQKYFSENEAKYSKLLQELYSELRRLGKGATMEQISAVLARYAREIQRQLPPLPGPGYLKWRQARLQALEAQLAETPSVRAPTPGDVAANQQYQEQLAQQKKADRARIMYGRAVARSQSQMNPAGNWDANIIRQGDQILAEEEAERQASLSMSQKLFEAALEQVLWGMAGFAVGQIVGAALNRSINITPRGLDHVLDRHVPGGAMSAGKSVFLAGEEVSALIRQSESVGATQQAGGNFQRIVNAGRNIGIDRATGRPTSIYTVITNDAGDLITAFPGMP